MKDKLVFEASDYQEFVQYRAHLCEWDDLPPEDKNIHTGKNIIYLVCFVRNVGDKRCYVEFIYKHGLFQRTKIITQGGLPYNMNEDKVIVTPVRYLRDLKDSPQPVPLDIKTLRAK